MIAKTRDMIQISKDINDLAVEYQTLISKMFAGLSNLSSNGVWSGDTAEEYINLVMQDKNDYIKIGDRIKEFATTILNHANSIESSTTQLLEDESNG